MGALPLTKGEDLLDNQPSIGGSSAKGHLFRLPANPPTRYNNGNGNTSSMRYRAEQRTMGLR
jgi:hypothetical protein